MTAERDRQAAREWVDWYRHQNRLNPPPCYSHDLVAAYLAGRKAQREEDARREEAIEHEAFMVARVYARLGEKESPAEIAAKLDEKCEQTARAAAAIRNHNKEETAWPKE